MLRRLSALSNCILYRSCLAYWSSYSYCCELTVS